MRVRSFLSNLSRHTPPFRRKGSFFKLLGVSLDDKDLVPDGLDTVRCIEGIEIHTSTPRDVMFRELYINGFYQDDVLVALRHLLRPGDCFWDVGANYGFMSIYVERIFGSRVQTIAFEPNPVVLPELYDNLRRNGCTNVQVEEICLSDQSGEVTFFTSADHSWNATLIEDFARVHDENVVTRVQSATLDDVVDRLRPPSVIKIDVEGAEHLVVRGARRFLGAHRVPIVAEFNKLAIERAALTPSQYLDLFRDLGYAVHVLHEPMFGFHKWSSLERIDSPAALPPLCNIILLDASRAVRPAG